MAAIKRPSIRTKSKTVLMTNIREAPHLIRRYESKGRTADAERVKNIVSESRAELARREALA